MIPEQSNASGPVPPHMYGLPRWASAYSRIFATTSLGAASTSGSSQAPSASGGTSTSPALAYPLAISWTWSTYHQARL